MALRRVSIGSNESTLTEEEIIERLSNPDQYSLSKTEWIRWKIWDGEIVYKAQPVMLSICMKRYDITRRLIDAGYPVTRCVHNGQISNIVGCCRVRNPIVGSEWDGLEYGEYYIFDLPRMILGSLDMPDDIRLLLWRRIKEEKERYWKEKGYPQGHVFDMEDDSDRKPNAIVGFGPDLNPQEKSRLYHEQVIKTLELFARETPEFLEEFIRWDIMFFLGKTTEIFCNNLIKFFLEKVAHTLEQRIILLHAYHRMSKFCGEIYYMQEGFGYNWVHLYMDIKVYYQDENLREFFYYCLLQEAIRSYEENYYRYEGWSQEMKESEGLLLDLIKEVQPPSITFEAFVKLLENLLFDRNIESSIYFDQYDWEKDVDEKYRENLDYGVHLYEALYDQKVLPNNVEKKHALENDESQHHCKHIVIDWLNSVKQFVFDENNKLNTKQLFVLSCKDCDILTVALQTGLFSGVYWNKAVECCMEDADLRFLVPCFMAYTEKS